ncbi:glycoside hydrolase family 38 N-terminal domain-containing protein [Paenibacillus eucommiae]|uniref:Alpha-mannosidase/mannosylglycerate hydrolase n=1 Tax=Paenibacillus eucommiae TaxID=1355755 RepID=A0ABS4IWA7_9BACL|nr:glycosyl hydrolase-related protein [Paenibacillus eucommiae]MBP1991881.1 alpha-mannosidase/mannosylglycerate hydrolase [Paenibacillus eucommiae]
MSKPTIYYYSSTHWDREWYESFQGFRFRLVEMMNEMIEVMEKQADFQTFHLDGQTIVLEDFIEIAPEKKEQLARLIQEGRVVIGPWYVMPDEFLVSGESLIRNLLIGRHISKEWGTEPWKYGFVCDIFGHIAQMPQIFNGFDIPYALLGRGLNEQDVPAHFRWSSPDGSECLTFKLQDHSSYGAFLVVLLNAENKHLSPEDTKESIRKAIDLEMTRSPIPVILLMDCQDHARIRPNTGDYLKMIRELYPEAEIRHTNLEQMGRQLESFRDQMPVRQGELNEPGKNPGSNYLITHTLSSRYPLKQANDECQVLLEKWAEPIAALSDLTGYPIPHTYIPLAYKYLIKNHPHDSICGCSIDKVHQDMQYRFDQSKEIARLVTESFLNKEIKRLESKESDGTRVLSLWNPLFFPRRCVVTLDIDFDPGYSAQFQEPFGYELKNSFKIYDYQGKKIPYGLIQIKKNYNIKDHEKATKVVDRHTISLEVELPAMGTAVYKVVPSKEPSRYLDRLSRTDREAENEYVKLVINDNGTIMVTDKQSGIRYDNLLSYLDNGEIGDGWYHASPVEDRIISSRGADCTIETIENGPVRTVFQITHEIKIPKYMEQQVHGLRRSNEQVKLVIRSRIGLSQGAHYVDVETAIDNQARDHRLRLVIPTGILSTSYFVNQQFAFVERKTGLRTETQSWKERDVPEKQMNGIVGKRFEGVMGSGGIEAGAEAGVSGTGLAFVSAYGLHECAAPDDQNGSLHITLYRSFQKTYLTNGEDGGQIIGPLSFKYALAVMDASTSYADLTRLQEHLQADVYSSSVKVDEAFVPAEPISYFQLSESDICLSILKRPEDNKGGELIVRCYNLSEQASFARFSSFKTIKNVTETNLYEEAVKEIAHDPDGFDIHLEKWKIQTFRIKLEH